MITRKIWVVFSLFVCSFGVRKFHERESLPKTEIHVEEQKSFHAQADRVDVDNSLKLDFSSLFEDTQFPLSAYIPYTGDDSTTFYAASASLSNDYAIVGGSGYNLFQGIVHIYKPIAGYDWTQLASIIAPTSDITNFGVSVDVDEVDGTMIIGGMSGDAYKGAAYIYSRSGDTWDLAATLSSPLSRGDCYGVSVSISDGHAIVGTAASRAYIYSLSGGSWTLAASLYAEGYSVNASTNFGYTVAIDGDYAIIGATEIGFHAGSAFVYHHDHDTETWSYYQTLPSIGGNLSHFGSAVDVHEDYLVIGANGMYIADYDDDEADFEEAEELGWVYIYERDALRDKFVLTTSLPSPIGTQSYFGNTVNIHNDTMIAGAYGFPLGNATGAAFAYRRVAITNDTLRMPFSGWSGAPQDAGESGSGRGRPSRLLQGSFPSEYPSEAPSDAPSEIPTESPTESPTEQPSREPTLLPSALPTLRPTSSAPTFAPTWGFTTWELNTTYSSPVGESSNFGRSVAISTHYAIIGADAYDTMRGAVFIASNYGQASYQPTLSPTAAPSTLEPSYQPSSQPTSSPTRSPTSEKAKLNIGSQTTDREQEQSNVGILVAMCVGFLLIMGIGAAVAYCCYIRINRITPGEDDDHADDKKKAMPDGPYQEFGPGDFEDDTGGDPDMTAKKRALYGMEQQPIEGEFVTKGGASLFPYRSNTEPVVAEPVQEDYYGGVDTGCDESHYEADDVAAKKKRAMLGKGYEEPLQKGAAGSSFYSKGGKKLNNSSNEAARNARGGFDFAAGLFGWRRQLSRRQGSSFFNENEAGSGVSNGGNTSRSTPASAEHVPFGYRYALNRYNSHDNNQYFSPQQEAVGRRRSFRESSNNDYATADVTTGEQSTGTQTPSMSLDPNAFQTPHRPSHVRNFTPYTEVSATGERRIEFVKKKSGNNLHRTASQQQNALEGTVRQIDTSAEGGATAKPGLRNVPFVRRSSQRQLLHSRHEVQRTLSQSHRQQLEGDIGAILATNDQELTSSIIANINAADRQQESEHSAGYSGPSGDDRTPRREAPSSIVIPPVMGEDGNLALDDDIIGIDSQLSPTGFRQMSFIRRSSLRHLDSVLADTTAAHYTPPVSVEKSRSHQSNDSGDQHYWTSLEDAQDPQQLVELVHGKRRGSKTLGTPDSRSHTQALEFTSPAAADRKQTKRLQRFFMADDDNSSDDRTADDASPAEKAGAFSPAKPIRIENGAVTAGGIAMPSSPIDNKSLLENAKLRARESKDKFTALLQQQQQQQWKADESPAAPPSSHNKGYQQAMERYALLKKKAEQQKDSLPPLPQQQLSPVPSSATPRHLVPQTSFGDNQRRFETAVATAKAKAAAKALDLPASAKKQRFPAEEVVTKPSATSPVIETENRQQQTPQPVRSLKKRTSSWAQAAAAAKDYQQQGLQPLDSMEFDNVYEYGDLAASTAREEEQSMFGSLESMGEMVEGGTGEEGDWWQEQGPGVDRQASQRSVLSTRSASLMDIGEMYLNRESSGRLSRNISTRSASIRSIGDLYMNCEDSYRSSLSREDSSRLNPRLLSTRSSSIMSIGELYQQPSPQHASAANNTQDALDDINPLALRETIPPPPHALQRHNARTQSFFHAGASGEYVSPLKARKHRSAKRRSRELAITISEDQDEDLSSLDQQHSKS